MLLNAQTDMEVIGEASNGDEAISKALELKPDVLLLDISMPGPSGIEVIRKLKAEGLPVAILVLTMHEDEAYFRETLSAGALGYIPKKAADTELISAIRVVDSGQVFLYPSLTKSLVRELIYSGSLDKEVDSDSYAKLSRREREVLQLVAQGYTNQQMADRLFLSVKTIETYKTRVMEKLDLHSRVELVRYALQRGLLTNEEAEGQVEGKHKS
ncbi:MAG: response regulator transcription factor [Chloroflexi bacterium]|nr:response regulator transcription factor [Chloroflexota bacterium]